MMFMITVDVQSGDVLVKERVDASIKTLGNWSNRMPGVYFLESERTGARGIRDHLKQFLALDKGDRVFVARISRNWAGTNMGQGFPEWMKRREFGTFSEG
jgi:hypothetical protein